MRDQRHELQEGAPYPFSEPLLPQFVMNYSLIKCTEQVASRWVGCLECVETLEEVRNSINSSRWSDHRSRFGSRGTQIVARFDSQKSKLLYLANYYFTYLNNFQDSLI